MKMRCFISLGIEDRLKQNIFEIQRKFKFPGVKLVDKNLLHITVKFLGSIDLREVNSIISYLDEIKQKAFKVHARSIGVFPSKNNIRVIWIGIYSETLIDLVKEIYSDLNWDFEFKPHITIARIKNTPQLNKKSILKNIEYLRNCSVGEFWIKDIKLLESKLTSAGPIYSVVYNKKLGK